MDVANDIPLGRCQCGCGGKTSISPQSHTAKGYTRGRPRDYLPGHNYENRKRPLEERLWEKIAVGTPDECWLFTGYRNPAGYGQLNVRDSRCRLAHKLVAEAFHGPCPPEQVTRHLCGNPACCNPAHLRWGTMLENAQDAIRHGTTTRGEKHTGSKLTADQVREIRRRLGLGEVRSHVARAFGVHPGTVRSIEYRQTWAWLDD